MAGKKPTQEELDAILGGPAPDPLTNEDVEPINDTYEFDFADTGDIENGTYHATVKEFQQGVSSKKNQQYIWDFHLLDVGRSLTFYTVLTPNGRWKASDTLQAIGIAPPSKENPKARFTRKDIVGKPCRVEVVNERYNPDPENNPDGGRMVPKITNVLPPNAETLRLAELPA